MQQILTFTLEEPIQEDLPFIKNTLGAKTTKSKFILPTLPVDDYPVMTEIQKGSQFSLEAVDLSNLIDNTKFAISSEETRFYLNGIFLHVPENKKDKLRAVATDGHRLAQAEVPVPKGAENMPGIILPKKAVSELRKLIDTTDGLIRIEISSTKAKFSFPNSILTTKFVDIPVVDRTPCRVDTL